MIVYVINSSSKAKRSRLIGIDLSNALLIFNCNYGQYDKQIHKDRDSNKIISLLKKVLS